MNKLVSIVFLVSLSFNLSAQDGSNLANKLKTQTKKGDYIILELRLNIEDEFRTLEGGKSSLARIAVYSRDNEGEELISKGFEGMNSLVVVLNSLKQNGWKLIEVYPINGRSLILTHYVLERRK